MLIFLGSALLVVLAVGALAYYMHRAELQHAANELRGLEAVLPDVQNGRVGVAKERAAESDRNLANYPASDMRSTIRSIQDVASVLGGLFQGAGGAYGDLRVVSGRVVSLLNKAERFQNEWPELLFRDTNGTLIDILAAARDDLTALNDAGSRLTSPESRLKGLLPLSPGKYLALQIELNRAKTFLDVLVPYLQTPADRRFIIFLNNPSEMRPGGGFLGSYADITVRRGAVVDISVRDINEPDRLLTEKIVPPKPLQGLVRRWRAADANWFFSYPDSAQKTLELMEASGLYAASSTTFDGAFALTPHVVSDLLALTGPLDIATNGATSTITAENFLMKIQESVQAGQAAGAAAPKAVLATLVPQLVERLSSASFDRSKLFDLLQDWVARRDIRAYLANADLQAYAENYDAAGSVFQPPVDRNGDYLAVVNANVGGGKSDLFIQQRVLLQSQVNEDGTVGNHLVIARQHTATKTDPWWYRETNWNYLQLFVPPGAQLAIASGTIQRTIWPLANYVREGYRADDDVRAIESTSDVLPTFPEVAIFKEAGKSVFGSWSKLVAGRSIEISFDYTRRLFSPPKDGGTYQFVAERQAGATGEYVYEISAPVGFRWKENGLPVYEYTTKDHPGRLILDLTFEKLRE